MPSSIQVSDVQRGSRVPAIEVQISLCNSGSSRKIWNHVKDMKLATATLTTVLERIKTCGFVFY